MERITVQVQGRTIVCMKFDNTYSAQDDIILLTGAATYYFNYLPLMPLLRSGRVIVIHTPLHGYGANQSQGPAIENGDELVQFQEEVVRALVESKQTTPRVHLWGYSLGGMTLLRILLRGKLDDVVSKSIIMCAAYHSCLGEQFFRELITPEGRYQSKELSKLAFPKWLKGIASTVPHGRFVSCDEACVADTLCAAGFEAQALPSAKISKETLLMCGLDDEIFPPETVRKNAELFELPQFQVLPGTHNGYYFHPVIFAFYINQFIWGKM